jgi:PPM family protein phosphatase
MKVAVKSDRGLVRATNQDSLFADETLGLLMVADGMGGHSGGEVASVLATETISSCLRKSLSQVSNFAAETIYPLFTEAIERADLAIRTRASTDPCLKEMGTTLVLALCCRERIHIAHLGDSRAFLIHDGVLHGLTEDHSLVAQMVRAGELKPRDALKHRLRNVVTRSLGQHGRAEPEIQTVEWATGDLLLLCSDGLTNMVDPKQIQRLAVATQSSLGRACDKLVEKANSKGGTDNISVILAVRD